MKKCIFYPRLSGLFFILFIATIKLAAQTNFTVQTIGDNFSSPAGIFSGDIDMDGDMDVVAGSGVNGIGLWKKEGDNPGTWVKQIIDNNSGVCLSVSIADIVRDGNPDIVAVSTDRNQIIYYKNEGGDPIVWSKNVISSSISEPHELYVCDLDNDGNQDVFAAGMSNTGEITWWHNDGGDPANWTEQVISGNEPGARSVHVGDIDGDGDMDVAGAIFATDEVTWWRNDGGNPINWTKTVISNSFDGSHRIQIADMDSDGDMDILGTAYMDASIRIWRNNGGNPVQWSEHSVDEDFTGAVIGFAKDINSDGLLDIFGTAQGSNTVAWYENKGTSDLAFRERVIEDNFAGVWPAFAVDIDGDLDVDLLAGGFDANEIRWYENKQVGRFTNNIRINEEPTNLGFFVPEEYNPEEEYKLIVALHICGDENEYSRYRDNLIPLAIEMNAIIVAPDCRNTINNLDIPDADHILKAIQYTKTRFNIDEDFVYLTGGSCNGQTALKYGLEKIFDFRGVIPFNPYLPDWADGYYDFTSDIPVCFAAGTLDPSFAKVQEAFQLLIDNQGRAGLVTMPGIGHEFYISEFTETMLECIRIIDSLMDHSTAVNNLKIDTEGIKVFPNPFSDNLSIQLPGSYKGQVLITLHNLRGQEIFRDLIEIDELYGNAINLNMTKTSFPLSPLVLQVTNNKSTISRKILRY